MFVMKGKYNVAKIMIDDIDESPMAYKSKEIILSAIEPTVEIVHTLKPFYNFKAAEKRNRK